jgi:hypothetical protein
MIRPFSCSLLRYARTTLTNWKVEGSYLRERRTRTVVNAGPILSHWQRRQLAVCVRPRLPQPHHTLLRFLRHDLQPF